MWNSTNVPMQDGGFMNESMSGGQVDDKSEKKRGQNVVPLMIGHINRANDELSLWGISISIIKIVALVRNIEEATTKISYDLEDETGTIKGLQWLQADQVQEASIKTNTYIQAFGMRKEQNGVPFLLLLRIMPITNLAEITTHLLEITYCMQQASRMSKQILASDISAMDISSNVMSTATANALGMSHEQEVVYNLIKNGDDRSENGVERGDIKAKVPKHIVSKVDDIIEFLSSEGHIYTTSTDDHFKTT